MKDDYRYFKTIASYIEDGTYFDDAKKWYATKYIMPSSERAYSILLILIASGMIIYSAAVMISFLPITKNVPVTLDIGDTSTEYAQLIKLVDDSTPKADPDRLIQLYLAKRYVAARETYDSANEYELLEQNKRFVKEFSTPVISTNFDRALSIRNPSSPVLRYREHTTRSIDINDDGARSDKVNSPRKRQTQDGRPLLTYRAVVPFTSIETSADETIRQNWNAIIDFLYSPVTYNRDKEDFDTMEFSVINYQVVEQ